MLVHSHGLLSFYNTVRCGALVATISVPSSCFNDFQVRLSGCNQLRLVQTIAGCRFPSLALADLRMSTQPLSTKSSSPTCKRCFSSNLSYV